MKGKLALSFFVLPSPMLLPALGLATDSGQDNSTHDSSAKVRKVTACLLQGDGEHEYNLATDNGTTWELEGDGVRFAPQTGHTMAVSGTRNNAVAHEAKEKAREKTTIGPNTALDRDQHEDGWQKL